MQNRAEQKQREREKLQKKTMITKEEEVPSKGIVPEKMLSRISTAKPTKQHNNNIKLWAD